MHRMSKPISEKKKKKMKSIITLASAEFAKKLVEIKFVLTFTTLWANSADDKLIFFLLFLENRIWNFMQIVNIKSSFLGKIRKNISIWL